MSLRPAWTSTDTLSQKSYTARISKIFCDLFRVDTVYCGDLKSLGNRSSFSGSFGDLYTLLLS